MATLLQTTPKTYIITEDQMDYLRDYINSIDRSWNLDMENPKDRQFYNELLKPLTKEEEVQMDAYLESEEFRKELDESEKEPFFVIDDLSKHFNDLRNKVGLREK
jgi:PhoPQ-activated pathogenicity-related protein